MGGGPRERDVGGSARARPTDQRVLHSSAPGWRTRRRVAAAVAAPWNGLDGYAAAGLGPPAMDSRTNGSLVSYKESWEKK